MATQPPQCWISYRQYQARNEPSAPGRDWYGCRPCGKRGGDPRAHWDPAELQQEREELARWQAEAAKSRNCLGVAPVRVLERLIATNNGDLLLTMKLSVEADDLGVLPWRPLEFPSSI